MATLTSDNLQARISVTPQGWQFADADNPYDLNALLTRVALSCAGAPGKTVQTRVVGWELAAVTETVALLAEGRLAAWRSRLLDSGLHLWVQRTTDRGDRFEVVAMAGERTGSLAADFDPQWEDDWLHDRAHGVWGVRLLTTRTALGLFATELHEELSAFSPRHWRRPDNRVVAPPTGALRLELAARLRELKGRER